MPPDLDRGTVLVAIVSTSSKAAPILCEIALDVFFHVDHGASA